MFALTTPANQPPMVKWLLAPFYLAFVLTVIATIGGNHVLYILDGLFTLALAILIHCKMSRVAASILCVVSLLVVVQIMPADIPPLIKGFKILMLACSIALVVITFRYHAARNSQQAETK